MKNKKKISILALIMCITLAFASCELGKEQVNSSIDGASVQSEEGNASDEKNGGIASESETSEYASGDESANGNESAESVEANKNGNTENTEEFNGVNQSNSLADLYDFCIDSCVSIVCVVEQESQGFWGEPQVYEGSSLGSGFIIENNYVVTNQHVIEDAKSIEVVFNDGDKVEATLVGADATYDIAVLKIETDKTLKPVKLGDSSKLRVGEDVIAIGTPSSIEYAGTLTYGVISGLNRKISVSGENGAVSRTMYLIQTDATLNPGNSGGPLFNMKGEVVGINNMKLIQDYEGIGFSIPINGAMEVVEALIEGKDAPDSDYAVSAAYLGISGKAVSDAREEYGLGDNVPDGVFVVTVERKSAVYKAGLNAYDVITEFEGVAVKSIEELKAQLEKHSAGKEVTMKIYRQSRDGKTGETLTIAFKLDKAV